RHLIRSYTREAGVRNLEREIASVCRKATRLFAEGRIEPLKVDAKFIEQSLGSPRFIRDEIAERVLKPGVSVGLAWTPSGGDVLFVEAVKMPGKGDLILTGQLGDVMRESARAALSYLRTRAEDLGIDPQEFHKEDIHLHVPAGAVPKDGPSAGITILSALASLFTNRPVKQRLAMTGELTLTGQVLPVGGIKEKVLAAYRAGITSLILCDQNEKDVKDDIPTNVQKKIRIHYVSTADEVLKLGLATKSGHNRNGKVPRKAPLRPAKSSRKR
ncbi:MAG: hypothetical protein KIT74_11760, partial [Fimbriimonadales bacterium]|nr:hypothetical protein [Fimbriimonadales bacterium]